MGYLIYGSGAYAIELDDRDLTHLKVAIPTLLRAGKSVAFGYERSANAGSGRETLWIHPALELQFKFNGNRPPRINEAWVHAIIATSLTPTGLRLIPETIVSQQRASANPIPAAPADSPAAAMSGIKIEI